MPDMPSAPGHSGDFDLYQAVGGKDAPALYFGTTKMNNNFEVVDAIGEEHGKEMTATLFVKGGEDYIRVTTSVPKPDGSGRAIGTVLAGPALEAIKQGKAYYGDVPILGVPYTRALSMSRALDG